jgi:hypothetical protein
MCTLVARCRVLRSWRGDASGAEERSLLKGCGCTVCFVHRKCLVCMCVCVFVCVRACVRICVCIHWPPWLMAVGEQNRMGIVRESLAKRFRSLSGACLFAVYSGPQCTVYG